ncbi:Nucleotide sugar epimerase/dehydratase [Sulfitobacter noctilucicola]|uniref:FlaA1/EpsC-like NDP-sugar epimerase n=1 Tax=Sulfitobacter noctilucicola TaxID=1342301 RepID=A0A7W6M762_9RHOB|nr:nucleoside-diphosphate sugar epimerase/dehydratase [Sulfitobacter noctilucicola]KIN62721.1 Nucleotide sugar epimerase/dehydratase [Sulfitobacter noctilucicola]MBB4172746.1 FlaA1/EpsC-like NDP-sugar epimerase [Sulfitobacter noctilucicola]
MYNYLIALSRPAKQRILLLIDCLLVVLSMLVALSLRFGRDVSVEQYQAALPLIAIVTLIAVPLFATLRINRIKLSDFEVQDITRGAVAAVSLTIIAMVLGNVLTLQGPSSVPLIFGPIFLMVHIMARLMARACLLYLSGRDNSRIPVAIFGAGTIGVQLLASLRRNYDMRPVIFIDDNPTLHNMTVSGLPVASRQKLKTMVERKKVERVILAISSESDEIRRQYIEELSTLGCEVYTLPSFNELINAKTITDTLRPVTADMLLGRDKVNLETPEVVRSYAGRTVLVTGAGGSVGSELCRQILGCNPHRLVMFDHSEFALYNIDNDLRAHADAQGVELITSLGSVCDRSAVDRVIKESDVDIILHAAAYKHVPLVERNEIVGVWNNVVGTQVVADAAQAAGVERFILVSTDKAVRPTNVMGASKRLAELVVQDLQTRSEKTRFSMVRFGNVLGSSGSVIPLFHKQIMAGGPVTLTHNKINRYFMTISEAARLVLLAGAYSKGGDVFVLDMGKAVNIIDLARRMIELSGLKVRNEHNPDGDIEIKIVGLRPGEKLFEELLIGDNTLPTPHRKILRAQESKLSQIEIARILKDLDIATKANSSSAVRKILEDYVEGYHLQHNTLEQVQ